MSNPNLKEIFPGLYIRTDTPKKIILTREFIDKITAGSENPTFNRIMHRLLEDQDKLDSPKTE